MKVKLKNVRLSYPHLFAAEPFQGETNGRKRYGAAFIVPIGSESDKAIRRAIIDAAREKLGKKADAQLKAWENNTNKYCYADGALKEQEGYMILSSHRQEDQGAPIVIDRDPTVRLAAKDGKPYAGCYVNATVDIWIQEGNYPGVRASLIAVQFSKDGEAFGGAPARIEDDDFDDLSDTGEDDADGDLDDMMGGAQYEEDLDK